MNMSGGGRRPGELVVATTVGGTDHLAHVYKAGAIFSLCGLHDGLTPVESGGKIDCRRCRIAAAEHLREGLHDIAEAHLVIEQAEQRITYLRTALGGAS